MKFLLDNEFAPLTFKWGFLKVPLETAASAFKSWNRKILRSVKAQKINASLSEALTQLDPLGRDRVLFLSTQSEWISYFEDTVLGASPATVVGYLSQHLKCWGVACGCIPNTITRTETGEKGTWGAVQFGLYAPANRSFLNIERSISLINDIDGWEFNTLGTVQSFERVERYQERKKASRFTSEMLEEYCHALGIDLFSESFYGGPGFVISARVWFSTPQPVPLTEVQRKIGLVK